jgi:hypothetical protein
MEELWKHLQQQQHKAADDKVQRLHLQYFPIFIKLEAAGRSMQPADCHGFHNAPPRPYQQKKTDKVCIGLA